MRESWQAEGIYTDHVVIAEKHLPGMYLIETSEDGERRFFIGVITQRPNFG